MATKAERIFNETFKMSIYHIETWGAAKPIDAWSRLFTKDDECICRRTVDAVLKECDKKERDFDRWVKYGVYFGIHPEIVQRKALQVVRNTCDNWIKNEQELKAI